MLSVMSVSGGLNVLRVGRFSQTLRLSYPVAVQLLKGSYHCFIVLLRLSSAAAAGVPLLLMLYLLLRK